MTQARTRIAIIGAGPTGLGAALRLQELAEDGFEVFEGMPAPGGLSSSFVDDAGFTWDLGGHVQFSHYEKFDDYMRLALGDDGWLTHQRESWVWVCGGFVPYPFQNNLHRLPAEQRWECVRGLLDAQSNGHNQYADLASWIRGTFGSGISDLFLLPYNYKVWAYPAASLGTGWMGERIAVPALTDVLRSVCLAEDNVAWGPNSTFRFPRSGGTGQVWRNLAARLPGSFGGHGRASPRHQSRIDVPV